MSMIESRTFKSGNSVAVRLPRELGFDAGTAVTIEKIGDRLEIRPMSDPLEERRKIQNMLDEIAAIWDVAGGPPPAEKRDPDIFPDRPGLY